jgi:hypothetical protein
MGCDHSSSSHTYKDYQDKGSYFLVYLICSKCGAVLKTWTEPKR